MRRRIERANVALLAMTVVVAVLLFTPVVGFLLRCGDASRDSGGLLRVCWVDGEARYIDGAEVNDGICGSRSEELLWPKSQVPLSVTAVSPDEKVLAKDSHASKLVASAVSDLDAKVGFALFAIGKDGVAESDVVVHWGVGYDIHQEGADALPGFFSHRWRAPAMLRADVWVRSVSRDPVVYGVLQHELLHAAGLRDIELDGYIMDVLDTPILTSEVRPAKMLESEVMLLRSLYGPNRKRGNAHEKASTRSGS
jgi:hypothetical protein